MVNHKKIKKTDAQKYDQTYKRINRQQNKQTNREKASKHPYPKNKVSFEN